MNQFNPVVYQIKTAVLVLLAMSCTFNLGRYSVFFTGSEWAWAAVILYGIGAIGGFLLVLRDLRKPAV